MNRLIIYFLLLGVAACRDPFSESPARRTRVEMRIVPHATELLTRTDEVGIADVNLYLADRSGAVRLHLYVTSPTLLFEIPSGQYTCYVVANLHKDMGSLSVRQIEAYAIPARSSYTDLPMSARTELAIDAGTGSVVMAPVEVRRAVAKIAYRITVDPSVGDIRLSTVQPFYLPRQSTLFGLTTPSTAASAYMAGALHRMAASEASACSGTFYMFENPQGTIPTIKTQQQKDPDHAPACASYLLIRALRGERVLSYRVFLGENATTDFNVERNSYHTLNIRICGDNTLDTRVSAFTAEVTATAGTKLGGYCISDTGRRLQVSVESENEVPDLMGEIEVTRGDGAALRLDGHPVGEYLEFGIKSAGRSVYALDYAPEVYTQDNATLSFDVTLYDNYGYAATYTKTQRYANVLHAVRGSGKGSLLLRDGLYVKRTEQGDCDVTCLAEGCTVQAMADQGYTFMGWYADAAMTSILSMNATYAYRPKTTAATIYAKFRVASHTALDGSGTANCYLAPQLGTGYSFDARVQGNGKATTGITTRTLAGTDARVIWETGTAAGAVIRYAFLEKGRIYFATGTARGNALIGLFDATGRCIWSWHVWSTDYDPAAGNMTYATGYVFMDRNLGALSTDPSDVASKGLYYQWGRKDPFIGPRTHRGGGEQAAACYMEGYAPTVYSPQFNHVAALSSPLAWAAEHPTVLIGSHPNPAGSSPAYYSSWCWPLNGNLWGNATVGTTVTAASAKSIYDPCPAGWRVPPRQAFDTSSLRKGAVFAGYGWNMFYHTAHSRVTYYPYSGTLTDGYGKLLFASTYTQAQLWTCTPALSTAAATHALQYACYLYVLDSGVVGIGDASQTAARAIRCVKE